jgi:myo-inositol-1(or 4)-monophosphatase
MSFADLAAPVEAAMRSTRPTVLAAYGKERGGTQWKADGSALTALDLALEKDLSEVLLGLDPSWGLCGEESGWVRTGSPAWYLDPVDGTANFARRLSVFGSQLVLVDGIDPLFAAVYEPLTDVFTWAARGAGCWHQGERIQMPSRPPKHAVVTLDISGKGLFGTHPELIGTIRRGCYKVRALGSIAIHLRDIAVGATDGYVGGRPTRSHLHDLAPGTLMIREAGGIVSDGQGADALIERKRVVAASPQVHDWLASLLPPADPA